MQEPQKEAECQHCSQLIKQIDFKQHLKGCQKRKPINQLKIQKSPKNLSPGDLDMMVADIDLTMQEAKFLIQKQMIKGSKAMLGSKIRNSDDRANLAQDKVTCTKCRRYYYTSEDLSSLFYVEGCWHLFCNPCVVKYFDKNFLKSKMQLKCQTEQCNVKINHQHLKSVVGKQKFEEAEQKGIREMMNIMQCFKCKTQYEFVTGTQADAPSKNDQGQILSNNQKQIYASHRVLCPNCHTEQCKSCKLSPFHLGFTCKQYVDRAAMKKCRFCDEPLTSSNTLKTESEALKQICNEKQCRLLAQRTCTKMLACGHPCPGVRDEKKCLPCLRQPCCEKNDQLNGQNGDDYCNICFVEALSASPCVMSQCRHIFHEKCLKKRYEVKWLTPRIMFSFCLCPLCKRWVNLAEQNPLSKNIRENKLLFEKIQAMAEERIKFEEGLKDEKLINPESPYFQKPKQYAMAIYAYFLCFKCKKPYFGGRRDCMAPDPQQSFKPEELICPNCCQIPIEQCKKHGKQFIQFKCKFCCSIAQWFCWGNTHFCESCHKRQCTGDYISKYSKDALPKCLGSGKCPIGGSHNGNGSQKSLGCAICRNHKQNNKNF